MPHCAKKRAEQEGKVVDLPVNFRFYPRLWSEGWVMTEITRLHVQLDEMGLHRRVAGLSLRDRVRSSVIRKELGVELLLLCVERSQLRWFGHLVRMTTGRLPREVFQARPAGRRPRVRPRTRWRVQTNI